MTAWHVKAAELLEDRDGEFAFVATNSITQGEQVPLLFGFLYDHGWHVHFAHRTFMWDSEAPGKAAVHCVIVGFSKDEKRKKELWDYPKLRGEAVPISVEKQINAYLVDGPEILVAKASTPISKEINFASLGAMPKDGGGLIIETQDYQEVMSDPVAAKYVRPYRGSRELVNSLERWCLWLVDLDLSDISRSPVLQERLRIVREYREASEAPSTRELAKIPHLFAQRFTPKEQFLCLPRVVSELRPYFTVKDFPQGTIVSDATFAVEDPDALQFAIASSSMFITWQRTAGGRLKSDLRFASTLTWHTFPLPTLTNGQREKIIKAGQKVLDARALHPERSLADHYNPLAMDPVLVKAHDGLDREVDKAFGAPRKLTIERQRQELLFSNYVELAGLEKQ